LENDPSGAEVLAFAAVILYELKPLRKNSKNGRGTHEERTSVAKAAVGCADFAPGINPRPTTRTSFSASRDAVP